MAEKTTSGEYFVQCGVTALRDPATGEFLPSLPLYVKVPAEEVDQQTGLAECEKDLCADIAGVFADKFKKYVQENRQVRSYLSK